MALEEALQKLLEALRSECSIEEKCQTLEKTVDGLQDAETCQELRVDGANGGIPALLVEVMPYLGENCEDTSSPIHQRFINATCTVFEKLCFFLTFEGCQMAAYMVNHFVSSLNKSVVAIGIRAFSCVHPAALLCICNENADSCNTSNLTTLWNELEAVRRKIMKAALDHDSIAITTPTLIYLHNVCLFLVSRNSRREREWIEKNFATSLKWPSLYTLDGYTAEKLSAWTKGKLNELETGCFEKVPLVARLISARSEALRDLINVLASGVGIQAHCKESLGSVLCAFVRESVKSGRDLAYTTIAHSICDVFSRLLPFISASTSDRALGDALSEYLEWGKAQQNQGSNDDTNNEVASLTTVTALPPAETNEICLCTQRGKVLLAQAVDAVLRGIRRMQRPSSAVSRQLPRVLAASENTKQGLSLPAADSFFAKTLLGKHPLFAQRRMPQACEFIHDDSCYASFLKKCVLDVTSSYGDSTDANDKQRVVAVLKDIIRFSQGSSQGDIPVDFLLHFCASDISENIELAIEILFALYRDSGVLSESRSYNRHVPVPFTSLATRWVEISPNSALSVYEAFLLRCIAVCMQEDPAESPRKSVLYKMLQEIPLVTSQAWQLIIETLANDANAEAKKIKVIFQSFALLTANKPAIKEDILCFLLHCGAVQNILVRQSALQVLFAYLPPDDLYMVCDTNAASSEHVRLDTLLEKIATDRLSSLPRTVEEILRTGGFSKDSTSHDLTENLQKVVDEHVLSQCAFPLHHGMDQTKQLEIIFNAFANCSSVYRLVLLTSLTRSEEFHEALIEQCTDLSFHQLLTKHFDSSEPLVRYIVEFLAGYLTSIQSTSSRQKSVPFEEKIHRATTRVLVHTCLTIRSRNTSDLAILEPIVHFSDKQEFLEGILPELVHSVPSHIPLVEKAFLRVFSASVSNETTASPGEVLFHLHQLPLTESNFAAISKCIEVLLNLQTGDTEGAYILTTSSIVETLQKLSQLSSWPVLTMRTLIQCLEIHKDALMRWTMGTFLPVFISRRAWETDEVIWSGFIKVVERYLPDSLDVFLIIPESIVSLAIRSESGLREKIREALAEKRVPQIHVPRLMNLIS